MKPDLFLLGDSHTIALEDGATELGLSTLALRFSGAVWHTGRFTHGEGGFLPRGVPAGMRALHRLREQLGVEDVLSIGVPVLTTMGFHLGMLTSPLGWRGHQAFEQGQPAEGLTLSRHFIEAYVAAYRSRHLRVARRIARTARLIVLPPPIFSNDRNTIAVRDLLIAQMKAADLTVFDPLPLLVENPQEPLPAEFTAPDGRHGNAAYGKRVYQELGRAGLLD